MWPRHDVFAVVSHRIDFRTGRRRIDWCLSSAADCGRKGAADRWIGAFRPGNRLVVAGRVPRMAQLASGVAVVAGVHHQPSHKTAGLVRLYLVSNRH